MKEYIFTDGTVCYTKGYSKDELRVQESKHGKVKSIKKIF